MKEAAGGLTHDASCCFHGHLEHAHRQFCTSGLLIFIRERSKCIVAVEVASLPCWHDAVARVKNSALLDSGILLDLASVSDVARKALGAKSLQISFRWLLDGPRGTFSVRAG